MKRTLLTLLAMLSIATVMAKDSYAPTCVPLREYIYTGKDGIQIKIETSQEDFYPGFTLFEYSSGYRVPLRDAKSQIIRSFETQTPEMINLLKENFTAVEDGLVYFDYSLQEGDSINIIRFMNGRTSIFESYDINCSFVKVLSIDSIDINSQIRLRYNLELRDYESELYERPNDAKDGGYIYEYYEREELGKPYTYTWIEGIGYTSIIYPGENIEDKNELQCVFEEGELIYCADGADCKGLSDHANKKIDFTTLTLHRNGNALMAVFPVASAGETITLYDATGRAVAVQAVRQGATTSTIDTTTLPAGVYIARLNSGATAKVVL